jgi:acetate---CoA ligase (ADP-forming)
VASHTGALAGQEPAFNAAFRRAGVIRADSSEEMFDWARALAWCPASRGRNVAVLTNAGGPGVTAADALEALAMKLSQLAGTTVSKLTEILPPAASLHNPVDMLASATPEQYASCLQILLEDQGVDSVMVILPPPPMHTAGAVAKAMIPVIHNADKPVVVALMGERLIQEAVEHFRAARVPEYRFPERAASALAVLAQRTARLANAGEVEVTYENIDVRRARAVLSETEPGAWLPIESCLALLDAYGIKILTASLACSPEEAMQLAEAAGYPVVLKVASPDLPHKSDAGGVLLGVADSAAVLSGYEAILANVATARPEAQIDGIHVQKMLAGGQEVILGAVQDVHFGALVMFGSGGVEVEGLKDISFALGPLTTSDAEALLEGTWAGRKLRGYRNLPAADRPAVLDALFRLAQLAADLPELDEIEINPLRVMPSGQGAYALDVRARRAGARINEAN